MRLCTFKYPKVLNFIVCKHGLDFWLLHPSGNSLDWYVYQHSHGSTSTWKVDYWITSRHEVDLKKKSSVLTQISKNLVLSFKFWPRKKCSFKQAVLKRTPFSFVLSIYQINNNTFPLFFFGTWSFSKHNVVKISF